MACCSRPWAAVCLVIKGDGKLVGTLRYLTLCDVEMAEKRRA